MENFDVVILGSGPGGYVTAIRASQLGLKTAIVEKESLGGVCLNWGCIPTKALLKSAQVFEYLKKADSYGLKVKDFDKDFDSVVKRSRSVADGMSKGVTFLMKKNKIDVINGYGKVSPNKKVSVENDGEIQEFESSNIIIATGGRSRVIDSIPQDGKKIIGYGAPAKATTVLNYFGLTEEQFLFTIDDNFDYATKKNLALEELKNHFRLEFLNRIDDIILFNKLTKENINHILKNQIDIIQDRIGSKGIKISFSDEALEFLSDKGFDPIFGARPLKRLLQDEILNPLSEIILDMGENIPEKIIFSKDKYGLKIANKNLNILSS